jgi:4-amino-4-deoxy-L-arabinose transferase-like glycosyltransferase
MSRPLPTASGATRSRSAGIPTRIVLSADRVALGGLVLLAAALYLPGLTISGFGNTYYAAAAQAGSQSWPAMFFGSVDASGFITLDKPPLATWLMSLSIRALGLGSWAVLLPQAILGVGTVAVLFLAVRRSFGLLAATVAGLAMALTPVAVLIFRFDNPDALLTFLLVSAAWALGRGVEAGRLRWALGAAALIGTAFLTKYLQAYLVLPAFGLAWLISAPGDLPRRIRGLVAAGVVVLVSSAWWVAIVALIPASARPYIGGTTSNSVLELIFGYDGLGRLFAGGTGSVLGSSVDGVASGQVQSAGASFAGAPGPFRLFDSRFAGQVAWLLPASFLALGVGVIDHGRDPRTSPRVAGYVLWGGWLVTHAFVLSLMTGLLHAYYSVAMAPAIAALTGALVAEGWSRRGAVHGRAILAAGTILTGITAAGILAGTPRFLPGLDVAVAVLAVAAGLALLLPSVLPSVTKGRDVARPWPLRVAAGAAVVAVLAGPAAYSAATIARAHSDGDAAAGPRGDGTPGIPGGGTPNVALIRYLTEHRGPARWIVAVRDGANSAAIQLAAREPVMTIGGFTGGDPAPTLAQLQADVGSGQLRYVLEPDSPPTRIGDWVRGSCSSTGMGGLANLVLYDCAGA